ncbi:hypothetical protein CPAR01_03813 [Colletotrichum paranaense]|uniref:Uncharacterized protein n=2 Tax=Colletotrichum acutatum species complex TaxID=2707335 RepID=A0AAI9V2R5_9PEZI|nr:uncharacterized protein CPAR01_03813 [Colletotrichum paranaense]KAK1469195.1 hypothetical protein CMEL01_00962 [Colletotrichum melonis]KAK1543180.1 hypothetical protein CPAR01_03813 [Colletotrichum paranaense]
MRRPVGRGHGRSILHVCRANSHLAECRPGPRIAEVIGYKWSLSFTAHQLLVCRPCLAVLAPEKLHVAREVGGRIRIPGERLMSRQCGSGAAWESATAKLTNCILAESTRNKPWLPSSGAYGGREWRRRGGWKEDARLRRGQHPEIWF